MRRAVLQTLLSKNTPAQFQIDQFNHFLDYDIPRIISYYSNVVQSQSVIPPAFDKYEIRFGDYFLGKPVVDEVEVVDGGAAMRKLTPHVARNMNLSYSSALMVKTQLVQNAAVIEEDWINLGYVPIMIGSNRCHTCDCTDEELVDMRHDLLVTSKAGYFIVNGAEKVMVSQEKLANNLILMHPITQKQNEMYLSKVEIRAVPIGGRAANRTSNFSIALTKPNNDESLQSVSGVTVSTVVTTFQQMKIPDMPLVVLLRALGVVTDREVFELLRCLHPTIVRGSIGDANVFTTEEYGVRLLRNASRERLQEDALCVVGKVVMSKSNTEDLRVKYIAKAREVIGNELICQMGTSFDEETNSGKVHYIKYMVERLNANIVDDRDATGNKRLEAAASLMSSIFQSTLSNCVNNLNRVLCRLVDNKHHAIGLDKLFNKLSNTVTQPLRQAVSNGNWNNTERNVLMTYGVPARNGITHMVERFTTSNLASQIRRVNVPAPRESKNVAPRSLHSSQAFLYCCLETPEGSQCGLLKNLAITTLVTAPSSKALALMIAGYLKTKLLPYHLGFARVFLDGVLLGTSATPREFLAHLRYARRCNIIPRTSTIVSRLDLDNCIHVYCDDGRLIRPLFVAGALTEHSQDAIAAMSYDELFENGVVELLSADECANAVIATEPDLLVQGTHTHCEIHGSALFGYSVNKIPFTNMNQSVRGSYGASMNKQAISSPLPNFKSRIDSTTHVLHYDQAPITNSTKLLFGDALNPSGTNVVLALMSEDGFNQEDSIVINKAACDRGLFRSTVYRNVSYLRCPTEIVKKPDENSLIKKKADYSQLDEDGLIHPGAEVRANSVYLGKVSADTIQSDTSNVLKSHFNTEHGRIESVMLGSNPYNNYSFVKITARTEKRIEIGDKLASTAGQKGTIGRVAEQEDLPFRADGMVPDVIINPHAIPSRMTYGHMMEMLLGKLGAKTARKMDSYAFEQKEWLSCYQQLMRECDLDPNGKDVFYNGATGRKFRARVFNGVIFYQKLKHMVSDKQQSRALGRMEIFSRQPVEGRKQEGGARFGEMERDAVIAHGCSSFLQDRLLYSSDICYVPFCRHCGRITRALTRPCHLCNGKDVVKVKMANSMKILMHELMAMGVYCKVELR
jgi:DNA-directed RNA polymerase II subunit RPB2